METTRILIVFFLILLLGFLLFYLALHLTKLILKKPISARVVFKDFGQKMWMTVGMGIYFCVLYALITYVISLVTNFFGPQNLFQLLYKNPIAFIYLGLFVFVLATTSIYLVRMVIKFLYNVRYKG